MFLFFFLSFDQLLSFSRSGFHNLLYVSIVGIHESRHNSIITNYCQLHRSKSVWRCASKCFQRILDLANAHVEHVVAVASSVVFCSFYFISLKFSFSSLNFPFLSYFSFLVKRLRVSKKERGRERAREIHTGKHWCAWGHKHNTA